jgi:TrmH family RNA methyltransferase
VDGVLNARIITSLANETIKSVRALHMRKAREETGLFLAEGLKIVAEAVDLGFKPRILLYSHGAADFAILRRVAAQATESLEVTPAILEKISRRENPQSVLGVFDQRFDAAERLDPATSTVWVGLQAVRDPGNLGTIIRTADAAGCGGVILIGDCCDPYSLEAVRASMGSIFAVSIVKLSLGGFLEWRRHWPGAVVGTLLTATQDFRSASYRQPTLILMGNEQAGLPPELAAACDVNVKIPMRGRADSLNLAVATGVMIYAVTG